MMNLSIQALDDATQATTEFKKSFKLVLEDRFSVARANALLADIDSLLNVVQDLQTALNQSSQGE
jgi:hypothetical protein